MLGLSACRGSHRRRVIEKLADVRGEVEGEVRPVVREEDVVDRCGDGEVWGLKDGPVLEEPNVPKNPRSKMIFGRQA